tara:strand:- start:646 stop:822 length:177 start_codon:yes stop_codon:yes gene_type:complete
MCLLIIDLNCLYAKYKNNINYLDATNKNGINSIKEGHQNQSAIKGLGDRKIIYNPFRE